MCLVTVLAGCVSLDVNLETPSKRSGRISRFQCSWEGRCEWTSVPARSATGVDVRTDLSDLLAGIMASGLILVMNKRNNPYYFLPWLVLSLKGFLFIEGPSLIGMSRVIIPSNNITAAAFLVAALCVFVQQICLWNDVLNICMSLWNYRTASCNTDFYHIQKHSDEKFGFPAGIAQDIVLKILQKWELQAKEDKNYFQKKRFPNLGERLHPPITPETTCEDLAARTKCSSSSNQPHDQGRVTAPSVIKKKPPNATGSEEKDEQKEFQSAGDSYNGAIRNGYRWSQTISDLDVQVAVPTRVKKGRNVRVNITATSLAVSVLEEDSTDQWHTLVDGELCWRTNKDDSIWSLVPGQYVQLHLEKSCDRWWNGLFTSEPKIDLKNIDASRPMDELSPEEQMKIQELMWNQERKMKGLPSTEEMAVEKILKEAWDKEGSPFFGRPYDPKLLNLGDSASNLPHHCGDS